MLKILRRIVQSAGGSKNLGELLNIVTRGVKEVVCAEVCCVFLVDKELGEYVLMANEGLQPETIAKTRLKLGEGLVGLVGGREEPINIADISADPKYKHYERFTKNKFQAFLGVPIIHRKELLGVLVTLKDELISFDEQEEAFLVTLSSQIAGIIAFLEAAGMSNLAKPQDGLILNGMPTVPGVGMGTMTVVYPAADLDSVPNRKPDNINKQIKDFEDALEKTREEIVALKESLSNKSAKEESILFDAYLQIIESPSLKKDVSSGIRAGNWAQGALKYAIKERVLKFSAMEDGYLRERSLDLVDLGQRILAHLQATDTDKKRIYHDSTILVGEEITPAAIVEVPEGQLAGIVSLQGSNNSHTAILARALGIPAVMGITDFPAAELEDKTAIIDGYYGQVHVSPTETVRREFLVLIAQEQELDTELNKLRDLPAETLDGFEVALLVNAGLPIDVGHSLRVGAEGVGLYRTEVPFMVRDRFPAEEEQRIIYQQLLNVFAPRPVVMRTLDVGGDKMLPYFPLSETNPFLGWRGIRITLDHPEIFLVQIRAMLKAGHNLNNLRVMLPMISNLGEAEEALRLIKQAHKELTEEGLDIQMPQVGVVIEIPSAVYLAQDLARKVDFLSVGSNDLTQYLLAVDRNNARVANLYDSLHPAVLKALLQIVSSAHAENKKVSICGEMAGDPSAVILLLAMGFDALSMNAHQLLRIKWLVRNFTMQRAQQLLEEVLLMDDPLEIRCHMELALEEAGLAGLIRAGK